MFRLLIYFWISAVGKSFIGDIFRGILEVSFLFRQPVKFFFCVKILERYSAKGKTFSLWIGGTGEHKHNNYFFNRTLNKVNRRYEQFGIFQQTAVDIVK